MNISVHQDSPGGVWTRLESKG